MAAPVNSDFFHTTFVEFQNPKVTQPVEEIVRNAMVELDNGLLTSAEHLGSIMTEKRHHFTPEDYERLKSSRAYQTGFVFMDENYITLDYSRISNEHEFFKNMHRISQYMQTGHIDFAGPSLCTPGDIRISYSEYSIPYGDTFSIVAT